MGNISRHFDSETKWSTFGMYSEQVRKSRAWRNSWHSFIRKKKMVYCVAVACNNSLRGACVSYFWVTPNLFIPRSACDSSEVCRLLRHNSSQSSLGQNKRDRISGHKCLFSKLKSRISPELNRIFHGKFGNDLFICSTNGYAKSFWALHFTFNQFADRLVAVTTIAQQLIFIRVQTISLATG